MKSRKENERERPGAGHRPGRDCLATGPGQGCETATLEKRPGVLAVATRSEIDTVFNIYREVSFSVIKLGAEINQNW